LLGALFVWSLPLLKRAGRFTTYIDKHYLLWSNWKWCTPFLFVWSTSTGLGLFKHTCFFLLNKPWHRWSPTHYPSPVST
jgi:hypothetical protein